MKILLAYVVTQRLFEDFHRTLSCQLQFPHARDGFGQVLVTDTDMDNAVPSVKADCWVGGQFCLAKARNASIDYAIKHGFDWLVTLDADSVVLNMPTILPRSGFAQINVFQHPSQTPYHDFDLSNPNFWHLMGWYLIHRDVFSKHRFCEEFVGYGFEEDDYRLNVLKDVQPMVTDMRAIHLYHPMRCNQVFNKDLFDRRRGPVVNQCKIPVP